MPVETVAHRERAVKGLRVPQRVPTFRSQVCQTLDCTLVCRMLSSPQYKNEIKYSLGKRVKQHAKLFLKCNNIVIAPNKVLNGRN